MKHINTLVSPRFSLSLVVTEITHNGAGRVWAYLLPTHLLGNKEVCRMMQPDNFKTGCDSHWYPVGFGVDAVQALQHLDIHIEQAQRTRWIPECIWLPENRFAAIVWNAATGYIENARPIPAMSKILQMPDVSVLSQETPQLTA